jgi:hypothetical protein
VSWINFRDPSFVTMNPKFICIFRYHQSYTGSITWHDGTRNLCFIIW